MMVSGTSVNCRLSQIIWLDLTGCYRPRASDIFTIEYLLELCSAEKLWSNAQHIERQ